MKTIAVFGEPAHLGIPDEVSGGKELWPDGGAFRILVDWISGSLVEARSLRRFLSARESDRLRVVAVGREGR